MTAPKPWHENYIGKYYWEYRKYGKKLQSPKERFFFAGRHLVCYALEMMKAVFRVLLRTAANLLHLSTGKIGRQNDT